jgi:predicted RNA-binding Zn-ribbon protein involved in translation (DUF1610 family)
MSCISDRFLPAVIAITQRKSLQSDDVTTVVSLLQGADIRTVHKKEHVAAVAAKKAAFNNIAAGDTCPRCGGTMVLRSWKNGRFLGCSNYPKCRFTKALP